VRTPWARSKGCSSFPPAPYILNSLQAMTKGRSSGTRTARRIIRCRIALRPIGDFLERWLCRRRLCTRWSAGWWDVLPHPGILPSGLSIDLPECFRRHVSVSSEHEVSPTKSVCRRFMKAPHDRRACLSRPDLALPKPRRAAEGTEHFGRGNAGCLFLPTAIRAPVHDG
jgi:hypothetical protein